eukprot:4772559-Pyramimonas_sp.AAC.1
MTHFVAFRRLTSLAKRRLALQRFAVQHFMACAVSPPLPEDSSSPIEDVVDMYSMLSLAAGVRISRPTAAIALLRAIGVDGFEKR